jgi:hypothetical protein
MLVLSKVAGIGSPSSSFEHDVTHKNAARISSRENSFVFIIVDI